MTPGSRRTLGLSYGRYPGNDTIRVSGMSHPSYLHRPPIQPP